MALLSDKEPMPLFSPVVIFLSIVLGVLPSNPALLYISYKGERKREIYNLTFPDPPRSILFNFLAVAV